MPTLSELRDRVRERADMENSTFISDSELNGYINQSLYELYDLLIGSYDDYFIKDPVLTFSLSGGDSSNSYNLPNDFYKLRGVDFNVGGDNWIDLDSFNFKERNRLDGGLRGSFLRNANLKYRVFGGKIYFRPQDGCAGNYRLWYIPKMTELTQDSDATVDFLNWEEYAVVDSAIKCLMKEESDPSKLLIEKQSLLSRIESMSGDRDAAGPEKVANVSSYGRYSPFDDWDF